MTAFLCGIHMKPDRYVILYVCYLKVPIMGLFVRPYTTYGLAYYIAFIKLVQKKFCCNPMHSRAILSVLFSRPLADFLKLSKRSHLNKLYTTVNQFK